MKGFNLAGVSKSTWVRLGAILATFINWILVNQGIVNFPFTEAELAEIISEILFFVASLIGFWKNNSFTEKAQNADKELHKTKE